MIGFAVYGLVLGAFASTLPHRYLDPTSQHFLLLLGTIALWRYSWGGTHFVRSLIFRKSVFPRWRREAEAIPGASVPSHLYLLVTSFRIDVETTTRVYRAAIKEAIASDAEATIVASIVELGDEYVIRKIFAHCQPPERVKLCFVRISGTGKRDALALAFGAISRCSPPEGAVVAVVDGDSILPPGSITACAPFFHHNTKLGALTTDEICELHGADTASRLYRRWYDVRFAQRHILMSSVSLSRKVLTLTGRFSMFRAEIVTGREFIRLVQSDFINHWRLGRFRFLTGDDKSSWFSLLKDGWEMIYVPDVQVITVERPPNPNFAVGATQLMVRWFGNMLRTNRRALSIPIERVGFFVWWCLVDQRVSMWTSLFGLTAAVISSILGGWVILHVYVVWIGFTRLILTLLLRTARPTVSPWYPFLLYFNQIYGSMVKVYILHHLNRQKWTRQKTTLGTRRPNWSMRLEAWGSKVALMASVIAFVAIVGWLSGWLELAVLAAHLSFVFPEQPHVAS